MRRRTFLLSAGGAVPVASGCLQTGSASYTAEAKVTQPTDRNPVLRPDANIVNGNFGDPNTPLTVETTITNDGGEPYRYTDSRFAHLYDTADETDEYRLRSVNRDEAEYEFTGSCWVERAGVFSSLTPESNTLQPGETNTEQLSLLVQRDADCPAIPPEKIRFETSYIVESVNGESTRQREWDVVIERRGS